MMWAAAIPGGVSLLVFVLWFPLLLVLSLRWSLLALLPVFAVQFWLSRKLMCRVLWPHTCRAMAAAGYEVCPRCAFPLVNAPADQRVCPECGSPRLDPGGELRSAESTAKPV